MIIDYVGVKEINGSLIVMDGVKGVSNEEIVDIKLDNGSVRQGRVVQIEGERIVVQVFEGTRRISLKNTRTRLTGHPMEMPLSPEIIGRVLDGAGRPKDGLGDIFPVKRMNINGTPINPVSRVYPKNYINTGISTIDTLMTLIRGQKLPIFSGSGMSHNDLAVQIVRQAKISGADSSNCGVVFAEMGVQKDVAEYFRKSFQQVNLPFARREVPYASDDISLMWNWSRMKQTVIDTIVDNLARLVTHQRQQSREPELLPNVGHLPHFNSRQVFPKPSFCGLGNEKMHV